MLNCSHRLTTIERFFLAIAILAISGCIVSPERCNPSKVNDPWIALRCQGGGGMQNYVDALSLALKELKSETILEKEEEHKLHQQSKKLSQNISLYHSFIAENQKKIKEDEALIAKIKPSTIQMKEKKLNLEKELTAMKTMLNVEKGKNNTSRQEVYELSKIVKKYREALDKLADSVIE